MSEELEIMISRLPELEKPGRVVYVQNLEPEFMEAMKDKGYQPVDLMSLPRGNHVDEVTYLLAKAQAMEEGTVECAVEDRHRLALLMKAYGLLDPKKEQLNLNVTLDGKDVGELLDWKNSHHTLRSNTPILDIPTIETPEKKDGNKHKSNTTVSKRRHKRVRKTNRNPPSRDK